MKKSFTLFVIIAMTINVFAQSPQRMSYQTVIRNANNALVTNHAIGMRISILQGSATGTPVYVETQTPTSNANGLATIEIGGGTPVTGSFTGIDWSSGSYFIRTETDPTGVTNYTITGTSQVLSVPYALYSETAKTADYNDLTNKPLLFDGTWTNLTGKPSFATVATSGSYNDLNSKPTLFDGTWLSLTGKPATIAGYGITDAISTSHVANSITLAIITNWNTAYGWGDHNGLYRPISYVPAWSEISSKPTSVDGFGITDAVTTVGNQTIIGIKRFSNDILIRGLTVGRGNGPIANNTIVGSDALYSNTEGSANTAIGYRSLYYNTTGNSNTAIGTQALDANTTGNMNTANGNQALRNNSTGSHNTANGNQALRDNTTGECNTAIGSQTLTDNTTGYYNTAIGTHALIRNTTGFDNTAVGMNTLYLNTEGNYNIAIGSAALNFNTIGYSNTSVGYRALHHNTTGNRNTAVGDSALHSNTTGYNNTAHGYAALYSNTTGTWNTAISYEALYSNTTGNNNIAIGYLVLHSNTTGQNNSAYGFRALYSNTLGNFNTAIGHRTLYGNTTGYNNTAIGCEAMMGNVTGIYNTAIGYQANMGSDNLINATAIGHQAIVNASNKIVLGNSLVTSIGGWASWTNYSDIRLKENIVYKDELGLNFIMKLKPVSFNYITDIDKRRRDGLIAQDVQQVLNDLNLDFSGLVVDNDKDHTLNLSYTEFVIPLINAVQEQQKQIDELKQLINTLLQK